MIIEFILSLAVVIILCLLWQHLAQRYPQIWVVPGIMVVLTPLLPKIALAPGVYVHPAAYIIASLVLAAALQYRQTWATIRSYLRHPSMLKLISITIVGWFAIFAYGVILSFIRWHSLELSEVLRVASYALGMASFWLLILAASKSSFLTLPRLAIGFCLSMLAFSLIAIWRIAGSVATGGQIDFWEYGPQHQALGLLGQYLDLQGLQPIASGAAENAGWLMVLASFISLMLAAKAYGRRPRRQFVLAAATFVALSLVMLFTLSRASLIFWYSGLAILIWVIFKPWTHRLIASLVIITVTLTVITCLPEAPFVQKALNTVDIEATDSSTQQAVRPSPSTTPGESSSSAKPHHNTNLEITLEGSSQGRIDYWKQTLQAMKDDGWLAIFGQGQIDLRQKHDGLIPHSLLLQNAIYYGLLGVAIFVAMWGALLLFAYQVVVVRRWPQLDLLAVPLAAIVPGWLLSNLIFGGNFLSIELLVVFFGLLGFVLAKTNSKDAISP